MVSHTIIKNALSYMSGLEWTLFVDSPDRGAITGSLFRKSFGSYACSQELEAFLLRVFKMEGEIAIVHFHSHSSSPSSGTFSSPNSTPRPSGLLCAHDFTKGQNFTVLTYVVRRTSCPLSWQLSYNVVYHPIWCMSMGSHLVSTHTSQ